MARQIIVGWDVLHVLGDGASTDGAPAQTGSAATHETSIVRSGGGSLKVVAPSASVAYWRPIDGFGGFDFGIPGYYRVYVRITSLPASSKRLISTTVPGTDMEVNLNSDGTLSLLNGAGSTIGTSTTALTDTSRWYRLECGVESGPVGKLRIDGVEEVSGATDVTGFGWCFGDRVGTSNTYTAYFDDYVCDDAEWAGDSKIVLLLSLSDAQVGSWTGGAGGGSNLYDAVNNNPPIGTASETDLTQIESTDSSGDNATDEYRVNLQTYATGGLVNGDVIKAVQAMAWTGEDVSTGAKTGSIALISNPAPSAYQSFTFGPNALGTWPSSWRCQHTAPTMDPSVVLSNSPQVAIRKTDTGTRVASVCFVGLKVEYIPAVAGRVPHFTPYPQLLAH